MTEFLPPHLLALFAARDPIPYLAPVTKLRHEKPPMRYTGLAPFLSYFEDPSETPPPPPLKLKRKGKVGRNHRNKANQGAYNSEKAVGTLNVSTNTVVSSEFQSFDWRAEMELKHEQEVANPIETKPRSFKRLDSIKRATKVAFAPTEDKQQLISCILAKERNAVESEDRYRKMSTSLILRSLKMSTSLTILEEVDIDTKPVKIILGNLHGDPTCVTKLDYISICDPNVDELVKEINLVYERIGYDENVRLPLDLMLKGNVAIAFNEKTQKYCRVRLMNYFSARSKVIPCKLLDTFGEMKVLPKNLFKMLEDSAKIQPRVQQVRLEHLHYYDACVQLKIFLARRILRKKYILQLTGHRDENGTPLGYLTDESVSTEPINYTVMKELMGPFMKGHLFSKIGETLNNLSVTHLLSSGLVYLQNKEAPMVKHLNFLLNTFRTEKNRLIPMKAENMIVENFYLVEDSNGNASRVQLLQPEKYKCPRDYLKGVFLEYSDRGGQGITSVFVENLYLASDLNPILGYLPQQCFEVKLFKVPPIPLSKLLIARSLFPPEERYSVIVAEVEEEQGNTIFGVEIFMNKKKMKEIDPHYAGSSTEESIIRKSVNCKLSKMVSGMENVPSTFTLVQYDRKATEILGFNPHISKFAAGSKLTVVLESIYSYDDFRLIAEKDYEKRNEMEAALKRYRDMNLAAEGLCPAIQISNSYIKSHPKAIYFAPCLICPTNPEAGTVVRRVVVVNKTNPKKLEDALTPVRQVLLIDHGVFQVVALSDLDILTIPKYCTMPPLAVCASMNEKMWQKSNKTTFTDFKQMSGQTVTIKVLSSKRDAEQRTWVKIEIFKPKCKVTEPKGNKPV